MIANKSLQQQQQERKKIEITDEYVYILTCEINFFLPFSFLSLYREGKKPI